MPTLLGLFQPQIVVDNLVHLCYNEHMNIDTKRKGCIQQIFDEAGVVYQEPEMARVHQVVTGQTGKFRGIYYIWPEQNFYVGLAKSPKASIADKRMDTHVLKLMVNMKSLYGGKHQNTDIKKEPYKQFPEGWRYGVSRYLLKDSPIIPLHWQSRTDGRVEPCNLDFVCEHHQDPMQLPVALWNLNDCTPDEIEAVETGMKTTLWPVCNTETHRRRLREEKTQEQIETETQEQIQTEL